MSAHLERVVTRLSAAVRVLDAVTKQPLDSAEVQVEDAQAGGAVHRSSDGYCVIVGLRPGPYTLRVSAPRHLPAEVAILVPDDPNASNAITEVALEPALSR